MAIKIGIGLGTDKDPYEAIHSAINAARNNLLSEDIDLAIVFSTVEFAHSIILRKIHDSLGLVTTIGASSLALISNRGIDKYGFLIMLISLPRNVSISTASVKHIPARAAENSGKDLGDKLLYGFRNVHRDFGIMFSDGLMPDNQGFLNGLQERLGRSFPLFGGAASDNLLFKKTRTYYGTDASGDSACAMLWGGKLNYCLGIRHGWKPLGKPRYVTAAHGNIVFEIDGKPAVSIYQEYFNTDVDKLKRDLKTMLFLYPVGIYVGIGEEYLLRNLVSIEKGGALIFNGNIPEGSMVRLMIGTEESLLNAAREAAEEAKKSMGKKKIDFVLVFDSFSRYKLLGREAPKEIQTLKSALGEKTPFIGIYTYGEQAPIRAIAYHGMSQMQNHALSVVAVGG